MNIQCPECKTKYRIDISTISEIGTKIECAKCAHLFIVKKKHISKIEKVIGNIKGTISGWEHETEAASPVAPATVEKKRSEVKKEQENQDWEIKQGSILPGGLLTEEEANDIISGFTQEEKREEEGEKVGKNETVDEVESGKTSGVAQQGEDAGEIGEEAGIDSDDAEVSSVQESAEVTEDEVDSSPDAAEAAEGGAEPAASDESSDAEPSPDQKGDVVTQDEINSLLEGAESSAEGAEPAASGESSDAEPSSGQEGSEVTADEVDSLLEGAKAAEGSESLENGDGKTGEEGEQPPKPEQEDIISDMVQEDIIQFDDESVKAALGDMEETGEETVVETDQGAGETAKENSTPVAAEPKPPQDDTGEEDGSATVPEAEEGGDTDRRLSRFSFLFSGVMQKLSYYTKGTLSFGKIKIPLKYLVSAFAAFFVLFIGSVGFLVWLKQSQTQNVPPASQQEAKSEQVEEKTSFQPELVNTEKAVLTEEEHERTIKIGVILPVSFNTDETKIMSIDIRIQFDSVATIKEVEHSPVFYYEDIVERTIADFFKEVFYEDTSFVQERLKKEIAAQLNNEMKNGTVEMIRFENFLVQ